jgi:hypothetical protein
VTCECDYTLEFHRERNERLGRNNDSSCHNEPADHGGVQTSPALCMGCLFECAE